jgi:hypothetical protein
MVHFEEKQRSKPARNLQHVGLPPVSTIERLTQNYEDGRLGHDSQTCVW